MKRIINGKRYDTNTATEVDSFSKNHGTFQYFSETLYLKHTGEFFIHGVGGPASKYSLFDGNVHSGSEDIVPISRSEAKQWMENHSTVEKYEIVFGEVEE